VRDLTLSSETIDTISGLLGMLLFSSSRFG